ncbi:MAG TPA: 2-phosphosulfolactate phosphatase [Ignavibacteriaceae bacterium]|nr:2-phosphosulfolactate phosphatase [Ignavibacteriaceae bacterium]
MKINVLFNHNNADELYFTKKTTVVIDVLRASSTVVNAIQNEAKEIIPVTTVEFAVKVSGGMFGGQTLVGGERNTKKVEGFALGNSPLEYVRDIVGGKTIILYTTNGSKSIVKAKFSENLFVCSFLNLAAIVNHLNDLNKDFEILCAGKANTFSLEDTVCAGRLITELEKLREDLELTDSARGSIAMNKVFGKNLLKMLRESDHGKILIENGFEDDLKFCSKLNYSHIIPYFTGNAIKLYEKLVPQSGAEIAAG